jgi:hypothetical protein
MTDAPHRVQNVLDNAVAEVVAAHNCQAVTDATAQHSATDTFDRGAAPALVASEAAASLEQDALLDAVLAALIGDTVDDHLPEDTLLETI